MKRKLAFLIVLAMIISFAPVFLPGAGRNAEAAPSLSSFFTQGTCTASVLNFRQGPSTDYPVICKLVKGQNVQILAKVGNWYACYDPKTGCCGAVSGNYLKLTGTAPAPKTTPMASPKPSPKPSAVPSVPVDTQLSQDEQTLLNLVNKARANAGAGALSADSGVMKTARLKAKDMVDNNYFSHQSPTYGSPFDMMKDFGVTFMTAGENIAGNRTVEGAFNAWMGSSGHKANILNPKFNFCGIGIVPSPTYGKILVQQFIGR